MNVMVDLLSRSPSALVVDVAAKSTLVLALAAVVALMLRRAPAATRHLAWCLGLCGALVLPVMTAALPSWAWPVLPANPDGPASSPAPRAAASAPQTIGHGAPAARADQPAVTVLVEPPASLRRADTVATASAPAQIGMPSPSTGLISAWLAVAMLILAVPLLGRLAVWRLARGAQSIEDGDWAELLGDLTARLGLSRRVSLLRCRHALMPMTWGWIRPVILLPEGAEDWPAGRRRDVLLHELAHVQRFDCLTQAVAQAACALYWFNPLAWIAARRMRIERERACDDIVLLAGSRASDYAAHLLDLARTLRSRHHHSLAALAMAQPSHLEGRLLSILDAGCPRRGLTRPAVVLGLIALMVLVLPLSIVRLGVRAAAATPVHDQALVAAPKAEAPSPPEPRRTVAGRVVDEKNQPISGARVAVIAERRKQVSDGANFEGLQLAGMATSGVDGRFRVEFPTIPPTRLAGLSIIAVAPGYAFDGTALKFDAASQETTITLDPEKVVEGRLVDVQNQPVAGVSVRISHLNIRYRAYDPYGTNGEPTLWPGSATTDRDGRFRLVGLGARAAITLEVADPRFAHQKLEITAGDEGRSKPTTMSLLPVQAIDVRVVHDDDGKPVAGAQVYVLAERRNPFSFGNETGAKADDQGRVRIAAWPGDSFRVTVYPREGEPYLRREADLDWPKGAVQQAVEVRLRRGAVVQGKLVEEPSGKGVAGAKVSYYQTRRNNPLYATSHTRDTSSSPDGTFTLVVDYGPGHLLVQGPSDHYINVPTSYSEMGIRLLPDLPHYPDALAHLDLKPGTPTYEVTMRLRRGVTVRGRVIGPDGKPNSHAFGLSRAYTPYSEHGVPFAPFNPGIAPRIRVRDGQFEVPGCDPEKTLPYYFLDVEHQLGAAVEISGKSAETGPVTVRLQKCGSVRVRLVDAAGKPLVNHLADEMPGCMILLITPGADWGSMEKVNADSEFQSNLDGYGGLRTGPDGRVTYVNLIPGAPYRYRGVEFTAEAGKTIELADITVGGRK
jgi:beta-lactamase regulating signal transducer with metallopeptidase domain/protocatechuate 3,4-dioxygenase beta subunit